MTAIKATSTNLENKRHIATKCPVTFTILKIGGRWKPVIINQLINGTRRYSELKRALIGISEKMLIQSLKELEEDAIVSRKAYEVVPPKVEYSLTQCGMDLASMFDEMKKWAMKYNTD